MLNAFGTVPRSAFFGKSSGRVDVNSFGVCWNSPVAMSASSTCEAHGGLRWQRPPGASRSLHPHRAVTAERRPVMLVVSAAAVWAWATVEWPRSWGGVRVRRGRGPGGPCRPQFLRHGHLRDSCGQKVWGAMCAERPRLWGQGVGGPGPGVPPWGVSLSAGSTADVALGYLSGESCRGPLGSRPPWSTPMGPMGRPSSKLQGSVTVVEPAGVLSRTGD